MKVLAIVSTLDLRYGLGCTPVWWQLLKGMSETGNEIVVVPYLGEGVDTLWWQTRANPAAGISNLYYHLSRSFFPRGAGIRTPENLVKLAATSMTKPIWRRHLNRILHQDGPFDCIIFFNVPMNQIGGIPTYLRKDFDIPVLYYDGDMPSVLPETNAERGFIFDYYVGADLTEYDLLLVNSEGAVAKMKERGVARAATLHYGADPHIFHPSDASKDWDVAFFGFGSKSREEWIDRMVARPSMDTGKRFVVAGEGFDVPLGNATRMPAVATSQLSRFCGSAEINLSITASTHTSVYGSSTARLFELAAMGCCIVTCPYEGVELWFEPDKEILVLDENDDVGNVYQTLLSDDERMRRMGRAARERLMKDHTYERRALQLCKYVKGVRT